MLQRTDTTRGQLSESTRQVLWLTSAAILLLIAIAVLALVIVSRELAATRSSESDVERTREILEAVQLVLSTLQDAETGERGYVITGQPEFLAPNESARGSLDPLLTRIDSLVIDPDARRVLSELIDEAHVQMVFLSHVIDTRAREGGAAASAVISARTGKHQMDRIRSLVGQLHGREELLLQRRSALAQERSRRAERVVQIALGASILLVLIAGALLNRHIRRRLAAENVARNAQQLLASSMDDLTQGVAVLDSAQRLIVWNSRFMELRGLAPDQVKHGMTLTQIMRDGATISIPTPGGRMVPCTMLSAPESAQMMQPFDTEAVRADGEVLQIRGRTMPGGNYIVTYTDVTALKQSETAHRDQATRLNSIVDNVADAIITINDSGSIESWSKAAERLFGYQADEVLRRNVRMLMPDPHASAHDGYLRNYLQTGEARMIGRRREVEARHKDGRRIAIDLGISGMHIGSRRLFIGIVRDISERLEVERLKSGFVSTVSHELRTPLTSISGSLGLLAGGVAGELAPKATRLIEIAKTNCERLVRLINDILDLEKAESGKLELKLEALPLKAVVQQSIDMNHLYAHGFGVRIELDAESDDATVLIDHDRMMQVLMNLISNAAKFSPRAARSKSTSKPQRNVCASACATTVRESRPSFASGFSRSSRRPTASIRARRAGRASDCRS
jgi:PAS domain S-box-containing protein